VRAVRDVSFILGRGETIAIVGESGSGKSVTALSIMRLIEHGGGRIVSGRMEFARADGASLDLARADAATMRAIRGAEIAMIFQEPMTSLNPVYTVGEQIAEAIRLHQGQDRAAAQREALRMLEQVRIPEARQVLSRYPHQLSGGMRQRVMIAIALSCKPRLLIADEPTTALDVTIQAQILALVRLLQEEMHMAVMFITHDMGVVAEVADRVVVMFRGEKVEEGAADKIFHAPKHPYTRALLSAVPTLGAMRDSDNPAPFPLLQVDGAPATVPARTPHQPSRTTALLSVRGLKTRFNLNSGLLGRTRRRVHAVEQVSFELYPGETLALVGESGCGKSTTGRSLLRLVAIDGGEIEFGGRDLVALPANQLRSLRREIQMIFQDPFASLDPRLTVGFSVAEPLYIHGVASGSRRPRRDAAPASRALARSCAALSTRVLRGTAPAHRHRPRARPAAQDHCRGRGSLRSGCIDPCPDSQSDAGPSGSARAVVPLYLARHGRGRARQPPRCGDVPRTDCRDRPAARDLRRPAPRVYTQASLRRTDRGSCATPGQKGAIIR